MKLVFASLAALASAQQAMAVQESEQDHLSQAKMASLASCQDGFTVTNVGTEMMLSAQQFASESEPQQCLSVEMRGPDSDIYAKHEVPELIKQTNVFRLVPSEDDTFKLQVGDSEQFLYMANGQRSLGCSATTDEAATSSFAMTPVDPADEDFGFFIEGVFPSSSRFLSSQYNESPFTVEALISVEPMEEMRSFAKSTGDYRSVWRLQCKDKKVVQ